MRKTNILLLSSLALPFWLATGCGSGGADPQLANGKPAKASASLASAPVGTVHEVAMRGDATGFYFEPKELTIERGDVIRWKMVDGAPHNVNFTGREIPNGARVLLEGRKKMLGVMLAVPGQTYEIHFTDDFPLGEYNYVCDPHISLNMVGKITITDKNTLASN